MPGDISTKLNEICDLAEKYDALVMVDDSHAAGFIGKTGSLEARIPVKHMVLQTIIYRIGMYFRCSTVQRYINVIHFRIGSKP